MMQMESILWYFILYVIHKYVYKKNNNRGVQFKIISEKFTFGWATYDVYNIIDEQDEQEGS